ncbi:DUF4157 domain-containing protein [Allocoleopsis sp.]|uniref:eCIS core domain-containing protein n=1 Tax=Allocoleopsis sp. TaxID=3088169 RepID=UPI002FD713E8
MGFQRTHSFQDQSSRPPQPKNLFNVHPFEAQKLELNEQDGSITSEEQEQLGGVKTGMEDFRAQRMERAQRFGHNFANIRVTPPGEHDDAPPIQAMSPVETPEVPLGRQRSLFNSRQQVSASPIQRQLTIGQPRDEYEQEADRVASQVIEQINAPASAPSTQGQSVQRQEEKPEELQAKPEITPLQQQEEKPEELQAKSTLKSGEAIAGGEASTDLDTAINSARGGGQPLDASLQQSMGQAMGADFSGVRVHTDALSDQLNQSIQAKAFTTGQDVFFRQGAYDPGSRGGQELIAHELTHVVQQKKHLSFPTPIQRQIEGYQPGTLKSNTKVMKDLNQQQKTKIQELHNDTSKTYTINEARQLVGAAPLDTSTGTSYTPPFPFRYNQSGDTTMETVTSGMGGLVQYPKGGVSQGEDTNNQMSFAVGHGYDDLPTSSKRNITQTKVMDNISPNEAARKLGFAIPTSLSWEWLHLVAFSIGQTHVGDLSQKSQDLIKRTNQPQQISENLVLGTAAANTEMLSYETNIKRWLTKDQAWKLNLFVNARKQDLIVDGISIPVATRISYHFYFETGPNTYTAPVIVEFNTQSHDKPATKSFEEVCKALDDTLKNQVTLKEPLKGISTDAMDIV